MNRNRILIIVAIVIAAIGITYIGYSLFLKSTATNLLSGGAKIDNTLHSPLASKVAGKEKTIGYWINKKTGSPVYLTEGARIISIDNGVEQVVNNQVPKNVNYLKAALDGTSVLIAFGSPQNPTLTIYNLINNSWQGLPLGAIAASWSPNDNNRLVYLKENGLVNILYTYDVNLRKSTEAFRTSQKDLEIEWSAPDLVYFQDRPTAALGNSLWSLNLKTKVFRRIVNEEPGLILKWSSDGKKAVKFSLINNEPALSLISNTGANLSGLANLLTLPSKCAFHPVRSEIYCAAPESRSAAERGSPLGGAAFGGAVLPDDYWQHKIYTADSIYVIPLSSDGQARAGALRLFASDSEMTIDADQLEITGKKLYFINRYDNRLYELSL